MIKLLLVVTGFRDKKDKGYQEVVVSHLEKQFLFCVGHNRTSEIEKPVGLLFTLIVNPLQSFICIFRIRFFHSVFILGGSQEANYRQITSNNSSVANFRRGEKLQDSMDRVCYL